MNILVTGGAGYIGSHVCKALARAGYNPITYDNLIHGHSQAVLWGPLEIADIADRERLDAVLNKYNPAAVMHFAAYAYVGESVGNPGKYYRNNVAGTLTLLEALRDHDIQKLIFSSSCSTYGIPDIIPIPENHPQRPINPYGMSKLMIENMLWDFDKAHGLRSIMLRYFNASGADPDGDIGESHDPETHLIPLILDVAAGKLDAITIHGDDYDTPDGTCIRDFIHVTDLAEAHILALNSLMLGAATKAYNVGGGCGFSVNEVIEVAEAVTNCKIPRKIGFRRDGDPENLQGNAHLIMSELGWKPKISNLTEIVRTAWEWNSKNDALS